MQKLKTQLESIPQICNDYEEKDIEHDNDNSEDYLPTHGTDQIEHGM